MMKKPNFLRSLIFLAVVSMSATALAAPAGAKPGVSDMGRMGGVPPGAGQSHGGGGQPQGGGGQPHGGGGGHGYYGNGHGYYGHGHGYYGRGYGFGVYLGAPFYSYPYYYPYYPYYGYPYYGYPYYPPVVVETVPAQPPVYIEQGTPQFSAPQEPSQPEKTNWWYHCAEPDGYYPYVKKCPSGWEKVKPMQPPQQ